MFHLEEEKRHSFYTKEIISTFLMCLYVYDYVLE